MTTRVQKWGNSHGLRLKKDILDAANLSNGDSIDFVGSILDLLESFYR